MMLQRPNPGGEVVSVVTEYVQENTTPGDLKLQEFYQKLLDKGNNKEV